MIMKRLWLLLIAGFIIMAFSSGPLTAQEAPGSPAVILEDQSLGLGKTRVDGRQQVIYVVQTGDTLWDIAKRFLNSPFYWAKIWERNEFIINPNLIYPGDVLSLYPAGEIIPNVSPEIAAEGDISDIPGLDDGSGRQVARVIYKRTESTGFISLKEMEASGTIIESYAGAMIKGRKMRKTLLGTNDHVYVNVGTAMGARSGDIFSIYRIAKDAEGNDRLVHHPITGEGVGYRIINLGELELTEILDHVADAMIINSYENLTIGDRIQPYLKAIPEVIDLVSSDVEIFGNIIASKNQTQMFGKDEIVFIDRGKRDGVVQGAVFEVFIPGEKAYDPDVGSMITLPDKHIGKLVVVDPKDTTSVSVITESVQEFVPGQTIRTLQY